MARAQRRPADGVLGLALRTPTLPPATQTWCWMLGQGSLLVVDPGSPWPDEQGALRALLADQALDAIVLTHHHPDHVGGVAALHTTRGVPIWAHPRTADRLDVPTDRLLNGGELLDEWRVIHTPGHAAGHLCLFRERDGVAIVGDMLSSASTILLDPPEGNLEQFLDSLTRLLDLDPRLLLPAHGAPIRDARAALRRVIDHRHQRTEQIRDALGRGPSNPQDLVPGIYADVPPLYWPVAARQIRCHLDWLRDRHEVEEHDGLFQLNPCTG